MITTVKSEQQKRLHPHKFTLWVAIASIVMMFAGLTSAFIVKSNFTGWRTIIIPKVFWVSTGVILLGSLTIQMAVKAFKKRSMRQYRTLLLLTAVLGMAFMALQIVGFTTLWQQNVRFRGSSGAGQFFYAITGLHLLHVLGGVVALVVMALQALVSHTKRYSAIPVEVISIYWHFVDFLWIYLIIFFLIVG